MPWPPSCSQPIVPSPQASRRAVNPNLGFALQLRMLDPPGAWGSLLSSRPEGGKAGVGAGGDGPASWGGGTAWPPPWDLDRFLDAREACGPGGADDRTMQVGQIHMGRRGGYKVDKSGGCWNRNMHPSHHAPHVRALLRRRPPS